MSDDLTEKVARAIFDELCPGEHSPLARSQYARQRRYKAAARAAINAMSDVREALKLRDVLENVGEVYGVAGIRMTPSLPYNWYVVGPEGEVAYCQTENGEQHAKMIAAALNDRVAMCALKPALNSLSGGGK